MVTGKDFPAFTVILMHSTQFLSGIYWQFYTLSEIAYKKMYFPVEFTYYCHSLVPPLLLYDTFHVSMCMLYCYTKTFPRTISIFMFYF